MELPGTEPLPSPPEPTPPPPAPAPPTPAVPEPSPEAVAEREAQSRRMRELEEENRLYREVLADRQATGRPEARPAEALPAELAGLDPEDLRDRAIIEAHTRARRAEQLLRDRELRDYLRDQDAEMAAKRDRYPGYDREKCLAIMEREHARGVRLDYRTAYAVWRGEQAEDIRAQAQQEARRAQAAEEARNRQTLPVATLGSAAPPPPAREYSREDVRKMSLGDYAKLTREQGFVRTPDGKLVRSA